MLNKNLSDLFRKIHYFLASIAGLSLVVLSSCQSNETTSTSKEFKGVIKLDVRDSTPDWDPYIRKKAPEGSPNVLFILYDDTGLSGMVSIRWKNKYANDWINWLPKVNLHTMAYRCTLFTNSLLYSILDAIIILMVWVTITEGANGFPGYSLPDT